MSTKTNKKMSQWSSYREPEAFWRRIRNAAAAEGRSYNSMVVHGCQGYRHRENNRKEIARGGKPSNLTDLQVVTIRRMTRDSIESVVVGSHGKDQSALLPPSSFKKPPQRLQARTEAHFSGKKLPKVTTKDEFDGMPIALVTIKLPYDLHAWMGVIGEERAQTRAEILFQACAEYLDITRKLPEERITEEEAEIMLRVALCAREDVCPGRYLKTEVPVGEAERKWLTKSDPIARELYKWALEEARGINIRKPD